MDITVYTTPTCGYCRHLKSYLDQRGVEYTEHDVSVDRTAAEEMVQRSGQMGVPVTVIGDQVVVGFDRARLDSLLGNGGGNGHRPHFGLKISDASKVGPKLGIAPVFGAMVGDVSPSSPGEKAGIQPGDIITEFNMRPIHSADDLEQSLATLTPGQRAVIVLLRGQQTLKSEVVV
jgi:glutaredoxin-like YruB-family protein